MSFRDRVKRVFGFGQGSALFPFEDTVIEAVASRLAPDASERLRSQVAAANKIQRLSEGKEVNLYHTEHGKPAFDDRLRFPYVAEEAILATVRISHPLGGRNLKAEAWLVKGRLFSLLFDKPPGQFFTGYELGSFKPQVAEATVWIDPNQSVPEHVAGTVQPRMLSGWPRELQDRGWLTPGLAPLPDSERTARIRQIDAFLPVEYLELTQVTEGAVVGKCSIYGLAGVRKVVMPQDNFYILVDVGGHAALAVKDGSRTGELYFLPYSEDEVRRIDRPFKETLEEYCL